VVSSSPGEPPGDEKFLAAAELPSERSEPERSWNYYCLENALLWAVSIKSFSSSGNLSFSMERTTLVCLLLGFSILTTVLR
jgi:hypothetical protein